MFICKVNVFYCISHPYLGFWLSVHGISDNCLHSCHSGLTLCASVQKCEGSCFNLLSRFHPFGFLVKKLVLSSRAERRISLSSTEKYLHKQKRWDIWNKTPKRFTQNTQAFLKKMAAFFEKMTAFHFFGETVKGL